MKNRLMITWIVLLTAITLLCGAAAAESEHVHAPLPAWDRDAFEHWHYCDCGEKLDAAEHVMNDIFCTVCGSEIWIFEDETASIYDYSPNGDLIRNSNYDENGLMTDDYTYVYELDEQGMAKKVQTFYFDTLAEELTYAVNQEGEILPAAQLSYYEEGHVLSLYDEYGNVTSTVHYDLNNQPVFQETNEYTYDESAMVIETKQSIVFEDGSSRIAVINRFFDTVSDTYYHADGSIDVQFIREYVYDENDNKVSGKYYQNGVLTGETFYAMSDDPDSSWNYEKTFIEYLESGGKTVYEYDQYGELISEILYDAAGNVVSE